MVAPFKPFLSLKVKFIWTGELKTAFQQSKDAIIGAIQKGTHIFDLMKPTCLRLDWPAKMKEIGFYLLQQHCSCPSSLPSVAWMVGK